MIIISPNMKRRIAIVARDADGNRLQDADGLAIGFSSEPIWTVDKTGGVGLDPGTRSVSCYVSHIAPMVTTVICEAPIKEPMPGGLNGTVVPGVSLFRSIEVQTLGASEPPNPPQPPTTPVAASIEFEVGPEEPL